MCDGNVAGGPCTGAPLALQTARLLLKSGSFAAVPLPTLDLGITPSVLG